MEINWKYTPQTLQLWRDFLVVPTSKDFIKHMTVSAALAGSFALSSFVTDSDRNIPSAEKKDVPKILKVGSRGVQVVNPQLSNAGIYGLVKGNAVRLFRSNKPLAKLYTNTRFVSASAEQLTFQQENIEAEKQQIKSTIRTSSPEQIKRVQTTRTLQSGSQGQAVRELQEQLKELNYDVASVDGIFGSQTKAAVLAFQRDNRLVVDGIVGPETFSAMESPKKSPPETKQVKHGIVANVASLIQSAKSHIGTPYVWGGTAPSGFDCSGFLKYVYEDHGISIPRTVASIWNNSSQVKNPSVGDIVFFNTSGSGVSHAGLYLGNNEFIHSGTSTGVTISKLSENYWQSRYVGAKRVQ